MQKRIILIVFIISIIFCCNTYAAYEDTLVDDFTNYNLLDLQTQNSWDVANAGYFTVASGANAPGHNDYGVTIANSTTGVPTGENARKNYGLGRTPTSGSDYITFHFNPQYTTNSATTVRFLFENTSLAPQMAVQFKWGGSNYAIEALTNLSTPTWANINGSYTLGTGWKAWTLVIKDSTHYRVLNDNAFSNDVTMTAGSITSVDAVLIETTGFAFSTTDKASFDAFFVNPEPSTVLMMLLSLGGFGLRFMRNKIK